MKFDVDAARAAFPILQRRIEDKPLIYLDNAASAQKPMAVIDAMSEAMRWSYANVHRGVHLLADEATRAYEAARTAAARFLNAPSPDEVVLTHGGTAGLNIVAAGLGQSLAEGDEVVLSQMEHHSNIVPWHFLRERKGVRLRFAPVLDDGRLDLEALADLVGPRTKVISVSHMSNVLGTVNPVAAIADIARSAGARLVVDGCQGAVHAGPDVQALGCDFYVFTGHKLYGPTGVGVLWGRAEALESLPPFQGGGEMIESVSEVAVAYAAPPMRFEAGTPPIIEAIGLKAALDWFCAFDRSLVQSHEASLYAAAREAVGAMNDVTIIGEAPGKGAILTFAIGGLHAHDIAQVLDRYGVAVRAGQHCAEPLMTRFGLTSTVRASFALYNTFEEVEAFAETLAKARRFFS